MTKRLNKALQIRIRRFAEEAKRTRKFVKLSLVPVSYLEEINPIEGYSITVGADEKLYIILKDANGSVWNEPTSIWNIYLDKEGNEM